MPSAPCLEPGCPAFAIYRGRCNDHASERNRETHGARAPDARAVYGSRRWAILRRRKMAADPICEDCGSELATDVDHIIALEDEGDAWTWDNLRSLCARCHGRKTQREVGARAYRASDDA